MRKIDEAYEFIKNYITEREYPPTIREIGDAINVKSTSTVAYYLKKLEENNKIVKGSYKNRSIQLMENISPKLGNSGLINMPYLKTIAEGKALMHEGNISDRFTMPATMFKGLDMFLMPVLDNAMKDIAIVKGDIVVVSRQNVARNGEIIVAMVGSNYVIARLYKDVGLYKLIFENSTFFPIYVEKLTILGKVVGVIRNVIE